MPHNEGNTTRLQALWHAGHSCVRLVTTEEAEALAIVREAAARRTHPFFWWSLTDGLQSGTLEGDTQPDRISIHDYETGNMVDETDEHLFPAVEGA